MKLYSEYRILRVDWVKDVYYKVEARNWFGWWVLGSTYYSVEEARRAVKLLNKTGGWDVPVTTVIKEGEGDE